MNREPQAARTSTDNAPFVVLVVDDEPDILDAVASLLETVPSLKVHTAEGGRTALDLIRSQRVDLLLVDYHMQPMDGVTLVQEARRIQPGLHIIISSGDDATAVAAVRTQQLSKIRFLPKPFSPRDLVKMVCGGTSPSRA